MLMASLYTLDRMNGDSELIVMTAAGAPVWRIGAPSSSSPQWSAWGF
jgi:lipopolysaccharide export system permease protein